MKYVLFALLLAFAGLANAGNVTLTWTFDSSSSATCADGSPAATNCPVDSFQVQELVNNIWTAKSPNVSGASRNVTYTNVSAGVHTYRVLASSSGTLSVPSNQASITVAPSAPKAPVITVTVAVGSP